jgi:hypothetical protein
MLHMMPVRTFQLTEENEMAQTENKCIGLFGWLFGHKYLKSVGDYSLESDTCWRCGKPRG